MNRRTLPLLAMLLALFMAGQPVAAQVPNSGRWSGAIQIQGTELAIHVHFDTEAGTATIDIPPQGAFGLPLRNVALGSERVYFELPAGPGLAVFEATDVTAERIEGSFRQGTAVGGFYLAPNPKTETGVSHAPEEDVSVAVQPQSQSARLFGSLVVPEGEGPHTLVILHAGSGPTTRDGNTQGTGSGNDALLLLSDALYARGYAVLRYDKRGVGASTSAAIPEAQLRMQHFVDDLIAWIKFADADDRFDQIVLAGHSEGALIATLAALELKGLTQGIEAQGIDGLILIAGAGRPASVVLREQLSRNLSASLYQEADSIIAELSLDRTVSETSPQLAALFRPSVQPYLISWFAIDPAASLAEVAKLDIPVLIIQGSTDRQVSVADADALAASHPAATRVIIDGMNHVLKDVSGPLADQLPSYGDPSLPLNQQLIDSIAVFLAEI